MDDQRILDELLVLLEQSGISVRSEPLGGSGGGLCTMKGQQLFFLDTQAPTAETVALCAQAVATLMDIEQVYIRPEVRQVIEYHVNQNA